MPSTETSTELQAADRVYRELQLAILSGKIQPRERLVERDLVAMFNVSRTPIREALSRLRDIGLLVPAGKRGLEVATFSTQEILNLYYVREVLERAAADLIAENITAEEIEEAAAINEKFKDACDRASITDMIRFNNEFHEKLLEASRNNILSDVLEKIRVRVFIFRYSLWSDKENIFQAIEQHLAMIDALRASSKEEFKRIVIDHMNVAKEAYLSRNNIWFS